MTCHLPANTRALNDDQLRLAQHLYLKYSADLLSFFRAARRMSKAAAADLVQQTFSEFLETQVRHPDLKLRNPRAFLYRLAICQCATSHRRQGRRPSLDGDDDGTMAELISNDTEDDVEYRASLRTEQRLVLRAMRRLTDRGPTEAHGPRARKVKRSAEISQLQLLIYFRFWLGLPLVEVAEIFEVTPGVISGRQRLALKKLRKMVEEIEGDVDRIGSTSTGVLDSWRAVLEREAGRDRNGSNDDSK